MLRSRLMAALRRKRQRWNADDVLAVGSWVFVSNTVLLLAGTTTFVGGLVAFSTPFQGYLLGHVSRYLGRQTGVEISFESASAQFRQETIRLSNVHVRRQQSATLSHFDLHMDSVDVNLDLWRWLDGKGILTRLDIKGLKGVINRRHLDFSTMDPALWTTRRQPDPAYDLDMRQVRLEDIYLKVLDANDFRPYEIIIYQASLRRLRTQWLLLDFMCADSLVGEYDGALFNLSRPPLADTLPIETRQDRDLMRKARISGLSIDMLAIPWIKQGSVDIDLLYQLPPSLLTGEPQLAQEVEVIKVRLMEKLQDIHEHQQLLKLSLSRNNRSFCCSAPATPPMNRILPIQLIRIRHPLLMKWTRFRFS